MEGKEFVDFVSWVKTGNFYNFFAVHSAILEQKLDHVKVALKDSVGHWIPLQLHSFKEFFVLVVCWYLRVTQGQPKRIPVVLPSQNSLNVLPSEVCATSQCLWPERPISLAAIFGRFPGLDRKNLVQKIESVRLLHFFSFLRQFRHSCRLAKVCCGS